MKIQTAPFVAAALLGSLSFASAQAPTPPEGGPPGGGRMARVNLVVAALDTDKDGEISAEELEKAVASLKTLDKNGDGKLAADELRPPAPEGANGQPGRGRAGDPAQMLARIMENDKNGDGKITKDEMPERMANFLTRADTDGDGAVTKEELEKFGARMREGGGARPPRPDAPKPDAPKPEGQ